MGDEKFNRGEVISSPTSLLPNSLQPLQLNEPQQNQMILEQREQHFQQQLFQWEQSNGVMEERCGASIQNTVCLQEQGQSSGASNKNTAYTYSNVGIGADAPIVNNLATSSSPRQEPNGRGLNLWQWISNSRMNMSSHIKCALPLAVNLVELLLAQEENEEGGSRGGGSIPLEGINTSNILINVKQTTRTSDGSIGHDSRDIVRRANLEGLSWEDLTEENFMALLRADDTETITTNEPTELIEIVQIISSLEGSSIMGDMLQRLAALGVVLHELFSREESSLQHHQGISNDNQATASISISTISFNERGNARPAKKSQYRVASSTDSLYSEAVVRLEFLGIPQSLCTLVKNLLDCHRGEFVGDDAYKSFKDVRGDLQLMLDDPSRFLDNIKPSVHPSFYVSDKLYGRSSDIDNIKESYQQHLAGECRGVLVMGEAGVGKSCLVSRVGNLLAHQGRGYLLSGKWNQNQEIKPLSIVGSVFNKLCDVFARDASATQLENAAGEMMMSLGNQATLLLEIMPSISKIMSLSSGNAHSNICVDSAKSMRYLCCNLLKIISNNLARRIVIWLDDIQWSDSASMLLIGSLLVDTEVSKYVFFICSYRDEEIKDQVPFNSWLVSIPERALRRIHVTNLNEDAVNTLISDALQLFPRLTRPLSLVIHRKTRGNPLFVLQLLGSLREEGYLRLDLSPCRWMWDLEQIYDLEISDTVLELLMKEMGKLSSELQCGLKIASCMGSYVKKSTLDIISSDAGFDLREVLHDVSKKGFMDDVDDHFRFCHDRIEQAAYDLMSSEERKERHVRVGLTLCTQIVSGNESDEMLFTAMNQINRGGAHLLLDANLRSTMASLNLRAGKRCTAISDFVSAQKFYESGISFLNSDHWEDQYELSIELFEAMVDVACTLNDGEHAKHYSEALLFHAKKYSDKLSTLLLLVRQRRLSMELLEAKRLSYEILQQLDEELPRVATDPGLDEDWQVMGKNIAVVSDEAILGFEQNHSSMAIFLMSLYNELLVVFHLSEPALLRSVVLRMVQITLLDGLCDYSPVAFAAFSQFYLRQEEQDPVRGYRLAKLSLRLVDNLNATACKANVNYVAQEFAAWVCEPFQSIAESHLIGYAAGRQSGDALNSTLGYYFHMLNGYLSGTNLSIIRHSSGDFIRDLLRRKLPFLRNPTCLFHYQSVAFIDGLEADPTAVADGFDDSLPSWEEFMLEKGPPDHTMECNTYQLMRLLLFRQLNEVDDIPGVLNLALEHDSPLRPMLLIGTFYEGLVSFYMARRTMEKKWQKKGGMALASMTHWSQYSQWNFLNKALLLEAEMRYFLGDFEQATKLYNDAVVTSHNHRFTNEEAIASELAALSYFERKSYHEALGFFAHSVRCYEEWGASAVAKRVVSFVQSNFDPSALFQWPTNYTISLGFALLDQEETRKRTSEQSR
jgi:predicted ATPase